MVFRFCDAVALRSWERSDKRADLLARVENWVLREKVTTVIGEDQFFTTLASAKPPRPLLLRLLLDVLWVFPVAFLWGSVIAPWFAPLPGWARTFVSAAVITAALDVVVFPLRTKLRSHRLLPLNHTNSTGQPASTANIGRWGRLSSAVITFKKARA
jgi:antibiotic biosynthesis monooxygenase (ABM) superfamily enzyme